MLNFVAREDGWVLEKTARRIADALGATLSEQPRDDVDANIYFPYYLYRPTSALDICLFTHRESAEDLAAINKARIFDVVADKCDWCLAMSRRTADLLPRGRVTLVELPVDEALIKPSLRLGVCGIEQPFNRKRWGWIRDIEQIPGVEISITNGGIPDEGMPAWYDSIDYLLVLSDNEGGPMPVKEAIARCKPVIAPDVGWAWDYPTLRYDTKAEMIRTIRGLVPQNDLARICEQITSTVSYVMRRNGALAVNA